MNFDNLTNKEKQELVGAGLKGVFHAIVIPLLLMIFINVTTEGSYGGSFAILYIIIMAIAYNKVFKNKDFSKIVFNYTVSIVYGSIIGLFTLGFILAALS